MSRHYGIMSDRQRLGGESTLPAATRTSTPREYFSTDRINADDYELGGYAIFVLVVGGSCSIVLGLYMAYMVFVRV